MNQAAPKEGKTASALWSAQICDTHQLQKHFKNWVVFTVSSQHMSPGVLKADVMHANQMRKPIASWEGRQAGGVWNYRYNLKQPVKTGIWSWDFKLTLQCALHDSYSSFHSQIR